NAFYQRVGETLLDSSAAPLFRFLFGASLPRTFQCFTVVDQALSRIWAAVQQNVFHHHLQLRLDLFIDFEHAGIHNSHVHAGGNGVIEKGGMNGFANNIVAAKTERDVRDTAAHLGVWQVGLDPAGRVDVVNRVVVVLLHPGGDGENVGIEDNVFGREPDFIYQDFVSAFANADLVFVICGLALFVEGHYDGSGAVFQDGS